MPTVFVEVRFLKNVPAIIGSDMKVYGPFIKGRVYAIPKGNARILIKQKAAVATKKEAEKPTLKEMFKGEVLTPYIEAARVRPLAEEKKVGYRIGEPEETNAIKVIDFEVTELGNEHLLDDIGKVLNVEPNLALIKLAIEKRLGPDAKGMWLCDTKEQAERRYGPGEAYLVSIPHNALMVSDLGPDGKFWLWPLKGPIGATDEEKVIAQIIQNSSYWGSNICKRDTLEKYCRQFKGVKNPSEILDDLIRRGIAYTPRPGYIGLTEPEKYGLPPIERKGEEEAAIEEKRQSLLKRSKKLIKDIQEERKVG